MNIAVIGLSHKTTPVNIREKLSISEAQIGAAIAQLSRYPHIAEAAILSTCNRLEIYLVMSDLDQATQEVSQFLSEHSQLPLYELHQHLFTLSQQDAIRHLMGVASGLDSLVMGEGQILAQVKHTHKLVQQHNGCTKRTLNQLFKQAITTAKRVRTETTIGTGAVSISSAAVELAQIKVPDLANRRVTIVGAGNMARRLVQHLLAKKVTQISVVNRSLERARELAQEFHDGQIQCYPLTEMLPVVAASDLVFTSTSSTEPLLNRARLETELKLNQPLMLFDISVPRNIDADVNELTGVQVFNVDDLKTVVVENQASRKQAATEAYMMIEQELEAFCHWWHSQETVPVISCLREKIETIREQELEKILSRLGTDFTQKHQAAVEALTHGIVNKILHEPMVQLRSQRDLEAQRRAADALQTLFNLESCVISRHLSNASNQQPASRV